MNESLGRLARRVAIDPFFLAFALAEYAAAERLDENALAAKLGATPDVLVSLRLCRSPRADAEGFRADVQHIADTFAVEANTLATIARHGQLVAAMRPAGDESAAAALLAARDRPPS